MKGRSGVILIVTMTLLGAACQAAPRSVSALRIGEPPKIDGVLNEACWQQAQPITDFVLLSADLLAKQQTVARAAYDDNALYLGAVCKEGAMEKLVATQTKHGSSVWNDDCLEVFLDPNHDRFNYFHFIVNPLGTQYEEARDAAGVAPDWFAVWESKTSRGPDFWSAELAIPFAILSISRKVGDTWGFNVCREEKPSGELSCWSQTGAKFAVPQSFGDLTGMKVDFSPYLLTLGVQNWGGAILGRNSAEVKVKNDDTTTRELKLRLTVTPPSEYPRQTEAPLGKRGPGSSAVAKLGYQMFEAGEHTLNIEVLDAAAGHRVCAATGRRISVVPLAEFDVFKSFYRDDVAVRYRVNVQPKDLRKYRVVATLSAEGTLEHALSSRQVDKLTKPEGELRFDTAKLVAGDYRIRVKVLSATGKAAAGEDLSFAMLRQAVPRRLVDVDTQNFLRVNGKRVFPVGIYATPGSEKALRDLREAGFSLVQSAALPPGAMKALLDKADENGLKVWVSLGSTLDFSKDAEAKKKAISELVAAVGNHHALLMWESIDEPAWGSQSADGLIEGYKFLRALDQHHPIWTNHAPRNLVSTLAYYNRATDIAGCDIYPVPDPQSQSNLPNKTIHVVGDEADKSVATVNGDKPIIMVLQGFGWAELSRQPGKNPNAILPTFEESRFMAYDAILHGARAINYWGTHYTEKPSKFYCELRSLVSELAAMQPVLTADIVTGSQAGSVTSPEGAVQMMRRALGGKTFIIAINTQKQDRRADFALPGLSAKELRVLFEGRTAAVRSGKFADDFTPYAVHVYTDDAAFNPQRKDFSGDLTRVPKTEAPMLEPGNLVENPSFEVDADDDLVPDRWGANYPFSMQLSEEHAHSGKRSVVLISTTKDFAPLAVEYGIGGIKADGEYTLSAWARTDRPGLEFRIYVEWTKGGRWYGGILPWAKGTGEWQQVRVNFRATPDPAGGLYAVVQIQGEGRGWFDEVAIQER